MLNSRLTRTDRLPTGIGQNCGAVDLCLRRAAAAARSWRSRRPQSPAMEPVYPGTCRHDPERPPSGPHALRFALGCECRAGRSFEDELQGPAAGLPARGLGDFVIRRRDGLLRLPPRRRRGRRSCRASPRSCVARTSCPRRRARSCCSRPWAYRTPRYGHLLVLTRARRAEAREVAARSAARRSRGAAPALAGLDWLRQAPPPELAAAPIREIWAWAIPNWRPERITGRREAALRRRRRTKSSGDARASRDARGPGGPPRAPSP